MKSLLKHAALVAIVGLSTPAMASLAYVSNEKDNTLSIIDTETQEVVETIDVGQRPRGILLSKDHTKLYICASDDDTVQVLDLGGPVRMGEGQFHIYAEDRKSIGLDRDAERL